MLHKEPRSESSDAQAITHDCLYLHPAFALFCLKMICLQKLAPEKESPDEDKENSSAEVAPPADKESDRLQQNVDPKLLVSSSGKPSKDPPARRKVPAKKIPRARVSVQNVVFVLAHAVSMLSLCAHIHSVQKPSVP